MSVDEIQDYYRRTYWDYRLVWTDRTALACHFGFYEDGVRSHAESLRRTNERVAGLAGIEPGMRVLDAGCGLGGTALWLAEHRDAEVLGISLSAPQIDRARRAARERGVSRSVRFEVADYTAIPAAAAEFDAVIATESLCHSSRKHDFVAEAARVLKPGGRLVVADYMRARPPRDPAETRIMEDWINGWTIAELAAPDDLVRQARECGFGTAKVLDVTSNMRPSLRRLYALTYLGWPISTVLVALGLRSRRAHGNVVASRRQYQALRRGLWRYHQIVAVKT